MTMAREAPEIDRLIEQGLALYGQGNLDGALEVWERALAIDPDNPQANSYVEYVRSNYELLTADLDDAKTEEQPPFGIADDEPEYQIEIQPGEIKPAAPDPVAPQFLDPGDDGWYIEEETREGINADSLPSQELTIAMSADEPPQDTLTVTKRRASSASGIDFDDATREYDKQRPREASEGTGFTPTPAPPRPGTNSGSTDSGEFPPEGTPAFGHPNDFQTPPGFGTQTTGIKRRELGFVHPTGAMVAAAETPKPPATTTDLGLTDRPRTPAAPTRPPPVSTAADDDEPEISIERNEANEPVSPDGPTVRKQLSEVDLDDDDLIKSLPSPRPAPQVKQITIDTPLSGSTKPPPTTSATTRDFPNETRAPAFATAKTREMPAEEPAIGKADTQDFEGKTQERGRTAQVLAEAQDMGTMQDLPTISIGAPTQDLGLRELAASALGDVHRAETTGDRTRADVVPPFDPIDARSTEILAEIDRDAPRDEAQEDRTRRRITALFERSAQWTSGGELERAVTAVDLALSEDPNSALAQKLIHRNRDTIMTVFQTYLGDLDRAPQLARPLHELGSAPISPRAAFLLSRIDGLLTIDEILDVCGMPRLEAYRYLCQLFLRGILR